MHGNGIQNVALRPETTEKDLLQILSLRMVRGLTVEDIYVLYDCSKSSRRTGKLTP